MIKPLNQIQKNNERGGLFLERALKQVKAKDSFVVRLSAPLNNTDFEVLNFLYQPVIGAHAYALWMALKAELVETQFESTISLHAELFERMDSSIPDFYNSRIKLEGIGLLKTFTKEVDYGRDFVYQLLPPSTPEKFFQDELLSLLLLEKVGEKRFKRLIQRFAIPKFNANEYHEITKKFLDVYGFQSERFQAQSEVLAEGKSHFYSAAEPKKATAVSDSFDWTYFKGLLSGLYVEASSIENLKETIYTWHHLYGINELEMRDFLSQSVDYVTNEINQKEVEKNIYQAFHQEKQQESVVNHSSETSLSVEDKQKYRYNSLLLNGFSEGEIGVIVSSESIAPMIFLEAIKNQKGGFVSRYETWAVESIKKNANLPDAVINVLIHYVLVAQGNATFDQKYAERIANDWAQKQISSPEMAMEKVKELLQEKNARQAKRNQPQAAYARNKAGSNRKESLPDWANHEVVAETPLTKEEEAYFEQRMKRLETNNKGGER